jgi:hypothetical protein
MNERTMPWLESWRADPVAREVADRHYNRQSVGADQFVPPGRCLVLRTVEGGAFWVTSWPLPEYVKHDWPGAWICSAFRNERQDLYLSSDLIRAALAVTRWRWEPPAEGLVTFVDPQKVRRKRDPGRCFFKAGFVRIGTTKGGLPVLGIGPDAMPEPEPPWEYQTSFRLDA